MFHMLRPSSVTLSFLKPSVLVQRNQETGRFCRGPVRAIMPFIGPALGGILVVMISIRDFSGFSHQADLSPRCFSFSSSRATKCKGGHHETEKPGPGRREVGRQFIAAVMAIFFFSAALSAGQAAATRRMITFMPSAVSVWAEMAQTPAERSKGLMYRTSMGELEAMMFSFEESTRQTFWMYHTRIPLTVIFLDEALRIVDMQNMAPCPGEDPGACPSIPPG